MNHEFPRLYARIEKFYILTAKEVFCLPESKIPAFVDRSTRDAYNRACAQIKAGTNTIHQIMKEFPLK